MGQRSDFLVKYACRLLVTVVFFHDIPGAFDPAPMCIGFPSCTLHSTVGAVNT